MILKIDVYFKMNTGGAREPLNWKKPETKNRLFHEMEKPIHLQTFPPQRLIMWRDSWHLMTLQPNRHSLGTITVLLKSTLLPPPTTAVAKSGLKCVLFDRFSIKFIPQPVSAFLFSIASYSELLTFVFRTKLFMRHKHYVSCKTNLF